MFHGQVDAHGYNRGLRIDIKTSPALRPLEVCSALAIVRILDRALAQADGVTGAHCVHELWMRHELSYNIERALEQLWDKAAESVPEWLPMRYFHWLPSAYDVALKFRANAKGRTNIYLVLLDFADRGGDAYGVYVGMSKYSPAQRFDQHKAGIRSAGSVLKRGIEVLTGPTLAFAVHQTQQKLHASSSRAGSRRCSTPDFKSKVATDDSYRHVRFALRAARGGEHELSWRCRSNTAAGRWARTLN